LPKKVQFSYVNIETDISYKIKGDGEEGQASHLQVMNLTRFLKRRKSGRGRGNWTGRKR